MGWKRDNLIIVPACPTCGLTAFEPMWKATRNMFSRNGRIYLKTAGQSMRVYGYKVDVVRENIMGQEVTRKVVVCANEFHGPPFVGLVSREGIKTGDGRKLTRKRDRRGRKN